MLPPDPSDRLARLRILDANANRATEGLRVVEEYARFALDDRHLTECLKQLRHDLALALSPIPAADLLSARETQSDVGATVTTPSEQARASAYDVSVASVRRVEQALRCLEEYSKGLFPTVATAVESLRYRLYTLARALDLTCRARQRLAECRLYVLIDGGSDPSAFASRARELVAVGVDVLQLRDKHCTDRELLNRARTLRTLTTGSSTMFIMNDRPDLARLAGADGVHVGQDELSVKDARQILGPGPLVGVSTHSLEQARQAVLDGADYIGCGPVFASATKSFAAYPGLEFLAAVSREITLPAFAIGGITLDSLPSVLATGIRRVAVSSAIDSAAAAQRFLTELKSKPEKA